MGLRPSDPEKRKEQIRKRREWQRRSVKKYQETVREETLAGERSSGLDRSTRVNPVNRERRKKRWEDAFGSEAYVQWVKGLPCIVEGCTRRDIECAHVKSRGAGGGPEHIVPLCTLHHREQHDRGIGTVQDEWGLDLDLEAARVWQEWTG